MPPKIKITRPSEKLFNPERIEFNLSQKGYRLIAGVDEAGRGPLAGPVVAAAVIIPRGVKLEGLADSKKLSPRKRDELFEMIIHSGAACAIGVMDHETIDRHNILKASLMAMRRAILSLAEAPEIVLIDGNQAVPNLNCPQITVVGGDASCASISAASIIAKVTRDRIMDKYQEIYPQYSFSIHRGYPTARHLEELKSFGPTEIHRKTFRPVEALLEKTLFEKP